MFFISCNNAFNFLCLYLLTEIIFFSRSKYKEPNLNEGFTEIVKINFVPKFKSKHEEALFKKFLIER